jgi:hypothetical protein
MHIQVADIDGKCNSRFPKGMTERKATARATADSLLE